MTLGGGVYTVSSDNFNKAGRFAGFQDSEASANHTAGRPVGTEPPTSWIIPWEGGGLAVREGIEGDGTATGTLKGVKPLLAAITASGVVSADLAVVVRLLTAIVANGSVTASLSAVVRLFAEVEGPSAIQAALSMIVPLSAEVEVEGLGEIIAELKGFLSIHATVSATGTTLTADSIAAATVAAINSAVPNMNVHRVRGQDLTGVGSPSNPWGPA